MYHVPVFSRILPTYDNAKAESFMKTLKHEEVDGSLYRDATHARRNIGAFIDDIYNSQRLHSALDYRSPVEFEAHMLDRIPGVVLAGSKGFEDMRRPGQYNLSQSRGR
jgi:transposase InsO family protein